jgi:hypothetical protein
MTETLLHAQTRSNIISCFIKRVLNLIWAYNEILDPIISRFSLSAKSSISKNITVILYDDA